MADRSFEALAKRQNTVVAVYHDAYAEWEVRIDGQRVIHCAHGFWGDTLAEAAEQAHAWLDTQNAQEDKQEEKERG